MEDEAWRVKYTNPVSSVGDIHFLTREEQRIFPETAKESGDYSHYALRLETGLCAGEPAKNNSYDTHLYKLCDKAGSTRAGKP